MIKKDSYSLLESALTNYEALINLHISWRYSILITVNILSAIINLKSRLNASSYISAPSYYNFSSYPSYFSNYSLCDAYSIPFAKEERPNFTACLKAQITRAATKIRRKSEMLLLSKRNAQYRKTA